MGKNKKNRSLRSQQTNPVVGGQFRPAPTEVTLMSAQFFSGPLPPPDVLAKYEQVLPGMSDRLTRLHERTFDMAKEQSEHRRNLESAVISGNVKSQSRGQWMAFWIVVISLALGTFLIYAGKKPEGLWAMFAPLGTILTLFVVMRSRQDKDLEKRRQELENPPK